MLVIPFDRCGNWGSKKSHRFREQLELRHTQSGFGALVSVLSSTDWRATPCIRTTKDRGWSGQGKEGFESYPELELRICKAERKRTPFVNSQEIARHNERSRRTGRGRKRQRRHLCPTKPGPEPELRDWVSTFLMNRTGYPRLLRHHHLHQGLSVQPLWGWWGSETGCSDDLGFFLDSYWICLHKTSNTILSPQPWILTSVLILDDITWGQHDVAHLGQLLETPCWGTWYPEGGQISFQEPKNTINTYCLDPGCADSSCWT